MSDNSYFFIDTNIFVYTFDDRFPSKKSRALALIQEALESGRGMISYQVVQEFLNVAGKKFKIPLSVLDRRLYLEKVLNPLCEVFPSTEFYQRGIDISDRYGYSFYDSLIITAALNSKCTILYSEDMQTGQNIERLTIVNPFTGCLV